MSNLLSFVLAAAIILATPGPTNTLLATSAALVGIRRSLPLIFAELTGYGLSITALASMSGPVLSSFPKLGIAFRLGLVLYLVFVAWRLWRADPTHNMSTVTWGKVFVTTLLNPKALIFAFAVFPPIKSYDVAILYGGLFAIVTVLIATCWILLGASAGLLALQGRNLIVCRVAAVVLIAFASGLVGTVVAG
jgi:threonine/homoserine/homoserine lactone efflux protein